MMTQTQLHDELDAALGDRPQRLQALRDPIREYCGCTVPRAVAEVRQWYREHEQELRDAVGGEA